MLAISQICARLDGIPLAIELAAARARVLSVEEIAVRLDDRFRLLAGNRSAPPRQQTLSALMDWSHDLLTQKERILFRRLSVFSGGWTLQAAEGVCAGGSIQAAEVLDLLTYLIDKSLVIAEPGNGIKRFHFLETIYQYSQERLAESKERNEFLHKHVAYFLKMAEDSYAELWGPKQADTLDHLEAELNNLRSALGWLEHEPGCEDMLLRMSGALWRFWEIRGYINEGRSWLERALSRNPDAPAYLRANGLRGAGNLARSQGDYEQAKTMHEQSLSLFRELGDDYKLGVAREIDVLGEIAKFLGDYPKSVDLHKESLALRYEIGDKEGIAVSIGQLGIIARDQGHYQQAREQLQESLDLSRELEDKMLTALALNNLGLVAYLQCEYEHASGIFAEALSIYRELDAKLDISNTLQDLGNVAKDQGDFKRAGAIYNECLALKQELGDKRGIARVTANLAEVAFWQGNYHQAAKLVEQSLTLSHELGAKRDILVSLVLMAYIAYYQGDYVRALSLAKEGLALSIEIDSPRASAYAKEVFGLEAYAQGNLAQAREQLQQALAIFQKVNDRRNVAHTLINLARIAYRQGDRASATRFLDESLTISHELKIKWTLGFVLEIMGLLQRSQGNYGRALALFQESLQLSIEQDNKQGIANCLGALAGLAVMTGQPKRAARWFAAAEKLRGVMGARMGCYDQQEYEDRLDMLRIQLDEAAFQIEWSQGNSMKLDRVIEDLSNWQDIALLQNN
jgi:tetratricopeptide (TPR) repeat protein